MTKILNKPKIPYKEIISYLFGAFFLVMSLGSFGLHNYIAGLLFFLAAIVTIPPTVDRLEKRINITVSGITQFFIVFLLVAIAFAAIPAAPAATNNTFNNSEITATAPSSANGSGIIAIPANLTQVATQNSTPKQNITSTAIPSQKRTSVLENKGKIDILTNPTGAAIIIDGISKGISPLEGLSVDAGTHTVEAYLSGYSLQKEKVEIANSETKKLLYNLVPNPSSTSIEASTSESTKAQVTTSDSKTAKISDTTSTNNVSNYKNSKSITTTTSDTNKNSVSNNKNSKSTTTTTSDTNNADNELVYASSKSDVYHAAGCKYVKRIKPENLITFKNRKEAEAAGYRACKVCGG